MATISSQAAQTDIEIDRGEVLTIIATITDATTAAAVDITNHKVQLVVQSSIGGTQVAKITNGSGLDNEHTTPASGITTFTLTHVNTLTASATVLQLWYYAIHWQDDSTPAEEDIAAYGEIKIRAVPVATIA